jgi:hypothetical protein
MAEIAVERRRGFPWWIWLLGAAALLLILWALLAGDGGRGEAERAAGEPVTELSAFRGVADPEQLVGRSVEIETASVASVTGDRDFWVSDGQGGQVLVILDQVPTPAQPGIEGRYDVNPGQTISIYGEVQRFPGWQEAQSQWNLDAQYRSQFENQPVYIAANRLEMTDWREGAAPVQTEPEQ